MLYPQPIDKQIAIITLNVEAGAMAEWVARLCAER